MILDKEVILMESVYSIEPEKLKNIILSEFYDYMMEILGYNQKDETFIFDCRYIHISDNIEDNFYNAYKERYPGVPESEVAMQLCLRGPMVDRQLPKNSVKILRGFINKEKSDE